MTEQIESYYKELYGEPAREAEFLSSDGTKIKVFKWNESQTELGVTVYATIGSSEILGDEFNKCEFFFGLTPEEDNCIDALAETACHGNGGLSLPNFGDTITLTYPLWAGTEMTTFLFADGSDLIPAKRFQDKQTTFFQLVPIYDSELEYKKTFGSKAFWEKFDSLLVPYWESARRRAF